MHVVLLLLISYTEYTTDRKRNITTKQDRRKTVRESHSVTLVTKRIHYEPCHLQGGPAKVKPTYIFDGNI